MATWNDVRGFLSSQYQVSNDSGNALTFLFETERGRSQTVTVIGGEAMPVVIVTSPIGSVREIDAKRLLELTEDGVMGVKKVADYYLVVAAIPTADLSEGELIGPMLLVTAEADSYEEKLGLGDRL